MSISNDSTPGHFHAVQFYQDPAALSSIVAAFLVEGLRHGDPALIIATGDHVAAIERQLENRGIDVASRRRDGDVTVVDADDMLSLFMVDGVPDAEAFRHNIGGLFKQLCDSRPGCTLRAYGEMVNLLWKRGTEGAAIRVETLWNQLANVHDFKLLCGYSMGNFYKGAALDEIKAQHSHLMSTTGEPAPLH
jgi:hypothetical protein